MFVVVTKVLVLLGLQNKVTHNLSLVINKMIYNIKTAD